MTELDRARLAATAGFATTTVLLALTAAAYLNDSLEAFGWQGGEYAYAFVLIALGSALAGGVVKALAPRPWRPAGSGLLVAGGAGVAVVVLLVALFVWAVANWNPA
ncbi:hypothetical protein [Lentzea xinjiangensis]|uniref:hypothetical protein n=1 Tax=Lentzea xinjiangensis TaxID=402600 RepID=UPI001160CBA8|nr:hypothetical protein [Lentzea xinjiangensis]